MSRRTAGARAADRVRIAERVLLRAMESVQEYTDANSYHVLEEARALLELALRTTADAVASALILGVPCDRARDLREDAQRRRDEFSRWLLAPSPYL